MGACVYREVDYGDYAVWETSCGWEIGRRDEFDDWTFCPKCGNRIKAESIREREFGAYASYIGNELDFRRGK